MSLSADAKAIIGAGIGAVEPERRVRGFFADHGDRVPEEGRCLVVAVGKASLAMAAGAAAELGARIERGIVIAPDRSSHALPTSFEVFLGAHPIPNAEGERGARAVEAAVGDLEAGDQLLLLLSGGGSALMTSPAAGLSLEDLNLTTAYLLRSGAAIEELNTVRKHLESLKGGRLAKLASSARVTTLVLSDVIGDPLDVIASGPTVPDPTTAEDALAIVDRFNLKSVLPESVLTCLSTNSNPAPATDDACFDTVDVHVIANNGTALEGASEEARRLGYEVEMLNDPIVGEAADAGRVLAALTRSIRAAGDPVAPPACVIAGGETVVHVEGDGVGGRNQELVLSAALFVDGVADACIASAGTDGIDGPTEAAGGFVTGETVRRALERELDPRRSLLNNDSHAFLAAMDQLVVTGPTGTNVADIQIILVR